MLFRFYHIRSVYIILPFLALLSCKKERSGIEVSPVVLTPYSVAYPSYFPALSVSSENVLTQEGIALGRSLYYDTILSNNGYSCSSCHAQSESFSSSAANSLPHVNLAWNSNFLWNGAKTGSIEDMMMFEVEEFFNTDVEKLNTNEKYRSEFKRVFGVQSITSKEIAYSLAQFFRTLVSCESRFDQFVQHKINLSPSELRGLSIFNSEKGDCFHCHSLGLFTDNNFHNIGLDSLFYGSNLGRYNATGNSLDKGLFKTPTLRNIEVTSPYMHDGRFETLEEVVEHYNSQVKLSNTVDPIMTKSSKKYGLQLTLQEKSDLVAFLKTLTDSTFLQNITLQKP